MKLIIVILILLTSACGGDSITQDHVKVAEGLCKSNGGYKKVFVPRGFDQNAQDRKIYVICNNSASFELQDFELYLTTGEIK